MAGYRDPVNARQERALELQAAIEGTRAELLELQAEIDGLSRRWNDATVWGSAWPAPTRFAMGLGLGLGFVFVLPFLFLTLLVGAGVPAAALVYLVR
jgi:hypothetical protein